MHITFDPEILLLEACLTDFTHTHIYMNVCMCMGFPGSSAGKESTCIEETPVQLLGREDPLEKG